MAIMTDIAFVYLVFGLLNIILVGITLSQETKPRDMAAALMISLMLGPMLTMFMFYAVIKGLRKAL